MADADRIVDRTRGAAAPATGPDATSTLIDIPNQLRNYSSYTYGISLHLLTPSVYATLLDTYDENGKRTYVPSNVLIASAGRWDPNSFARNSRFKEDFYFENLEFTTVIGMNARSKGTNVVDLNFSFIEPYGMTFLNRLLKAVDDIPDIRGTNYLQLPYMLQIDFFGYDQDGNIANLRDLTKCIPIRLLGIKMKVSSKGSEYAIQAVQFGQQAFTEHDGSVPSAFEVTANTVKDFLDAYATEVNAYYLKQKTNGKSDEASLEIEFDIDSDISGSKVVSARLDPKSTVMKGAVTGDVQNASQKPGDTQIDPKNQVFALNGGTSVTNVIDNIIYCSEYSTNQIKQPNANEPARYHRIIPEVRLMKFDKKLNSFSKKIKYKIIKYEAYNNKSDYGNQKKAEFGVKKYEYIFTGKNTEILDFALDFNTMFYIYNTANKARAQESSDVSRSGITEDYDGQAPEQDLSSGRTSVMPVRKQLVQGDSQVANDQANKSAATLAAKEMAKSQIADSRGDMITVNLTILGDPDMIKQDDLFHVSGKPGRAGGIAGGSIATDAGELYVTLIFKTPVDIDTDSGLYTSLTPSNLVTRSDTGNTPFSTDAAFSGLFRVITVKNTFTSGQFKQQLQLVRIFDQAKYDFV